MEKSLNCIICKKRTNAKNRRPVSDEDYQLYFGAAKQAATKYVVCSSCKITKKPQACCETITSATEVTEQNVTAERIAQLHLRHIHQK